MSKQTSLGLATVTAAVATALVALLLFAGQAFAAGSVTVGDATSPIGGGAATVNVNATAGTGAGIGNYTIEVTFDPLDFTAAPSCTSNAAGSCQVNPGGASGIVRFAGASGDPAGLTGDVAIGTVVFQVGATATGCSTLGVTVNRMDDQDGNPLGPTATGGEVCVQVATPTPAATTAGPTAAPTSVGQTAAPTAAPTATARALPQTGGPLGDSTNTTLVWLLAASGLAIIAGGAWAVASARREI